MTNATSLLDRRLRRDRYQTIVAEVLALAGDVGLSRFAAEEMRARAHFATTARYEWMFWDAAWRREVWPIW